MRNRKSKSIKRLMKINSLWLVLPFTLKTKIYLTCMFYFYLQHARQLLGLQPLK